MNDKEYDREGRGAMFEETDRKSEKAPIATGSITISGLDLRIAMWPARTAAGNGPGAGKKYWPIKVEYKQGTKYVLAKVSPENIVVKNSEAVAAADSAVGESASVDGMPF